MPILKGTELDERLVSYRGTLITQADVMVASPEIGKTLGQTVIENLLPLRVSRICMYFASDLVREGLYCVGIKDASVRSSGVRYSLDLIILARVRELSENLSIDEMEMYAGSMAGKLSAEIADMCRSAYDFNFYKTSSSNYKDLYDERVGKPPLKMIPEKVEPKRVKMEIIKQEKYKE